MKHLLNLEIPRRSHTCYAGHESLLPGMECYSALSEDEFGKWIRRDYCLPCWEKIASHEAVQRAWSYWKSTISHKKKADIQILDKSERALELLHQALARGNLEDQEEAFVLALYLARNKKIVHRKEIMHSDGTLMNVYEGMVNEEMIAVPKIDLSRLQVEKIQQAIAAKLKN